jgi:ornithine cyclodeaminase/alanine dehydrogenase-like protein (mu-crystallin family)
VLVLDGQAVRAHLTPSLARSSVEAAMRSLRDATSHQPARVLVDAPGVPGVSLIKPAAAAGGYGMKVASLFPGNVERGVPVIQGFVVLLDPETGAVDALLEAASVTELRTAATSAVATDVLARRGPAHLGLLGSGVQARSHLLALREVRDVEQVRVWSRNGTDAFVAWAKEQGIDVVGAATAEEVVRDSDLVCACTSSPSPVLEGDWLVPGTHVNAVGAFRPTERELDGRAIARATVVVDMLESAALEAGAVLLAQQEGLIDADHLAGELTDVLQGRHPGRTSDDEITVFASTGLAVQDVAAARAVVAAAREAGAGVEVPLA